MKQPIARAPAILGIPYEEGTYWRKGSKHAVAAIMAELSELRPISVRTGERLAHPIESLFVGSLDLDPYNREEDFEIIREATSSILVRGAAPICLGGDHSISIPILRAISSHYGAGNFCVIHIDAHSDTFPPVNGYNYHHGATFRVAVEEGLIRPADLIQLGVRGCVREGGLDFVRDNKITSIPMEEWRASGLSLKQWIPDTYDKYYLSFDIDVVDPAYAPGTGTPVPGGLQSYEALQIIRGVAAAYPLIGADLVEVAPTFDPLGITTKLAAHLLHELLLNGTFVTTELESTRTSRVAHAERFLSTYQ